MNIGSTLWQRPQGKLNFTGIEPNFFCKTIILTDTLSVKGTKVWVPESNQEVQLSIPLCSSISQTITCSFTPCVYMNVKVWAVPISKSRVAVMLLNRGHCLTMITTPLGWHRNSCWWSYVYKRCVAARDLKWNVCRADFSNCSYTFM